MTRVHDVRHKYVRHTDIRHKTGINTIGIIDDWHNFQIMINLKINQSINKLKSNLKSF